MRWRWTLAWLLFCVTGYAATLLYHLCRPSIAAVIVEHWEESWAELHSRIPYSPENPWLLVTPATLVPWLRFQFASYVLAGAWGVWRLVRRP